MRLHQPSVTMTTGGDRCRPRIYWGGHGGHGGHGVFPHTYARAGERAGTRFPISQICTLANVCKNTMTTMTSMTNVVITRVVAVTLGGHGKKQGDQTKLITNCALTGI